MLQRSDEWLQARCGCVTASRVRDITATTKSGGFTADREGYMGELVSECLTGRPYPQYVNAAMEHGNEKEASARFRYALAQGVEITEVGFIKHPTIERAGASPDGLVGTDGLVEIKCPYKTAIHIKRLTGAKIEAATLDQIQFQMACCGPSRQWCDFVSFDDRLPEEMQLHIRRIPRDDEYISKMEEQVIQFLIDVNATVDLLRKRYMAEAA